MSYSKGKKSRSKPINRLSIIKEGSLYNKHIICNEGQSKYGSLQSSLMRLSNHTGNSKDRISDAVSNDYYVNRIHDLLILVYYKVDRSITKLNKRTVFVAYLNDDRFYKSDIHIEVLEELIKSM